jgi:hypothetical protein
MILIKFLLIFLSKFNPAKPITPKSHGFKANPKPDDMITCAVFVLDATTLEVMSAKITEKMKSFQTLMNQRGTNFTYICHYFIIMYLTKIEKIVLQKKQQKQSLFLYVLKQE